jgi:FkbM family methyltransferase
MALLLPRTSFQSDMVRNVSSTAHSAGRQYLEMASRFSYYNLGLRELKWRIFDMISDNTMPVSIESAECEFIVSNVLEYHRFNTRVGESEVLRDMIQEVQPSDVFLDVGANVGLYTCLVGDQLKSGEVVAFEPHPDNYERLNENVQLNVQNTRVEQLALSNRCGSAALTVGRNVAGAGGPEVSGCDSKAETVPIELTTGDEYLSEQGITPDVMKIDVEGHEYHVIDGLKKTLESDPCRAIYCEIHPDKLQRLGQSPNKVERLLSDIGFQVEELPMERNMLKAVPNTR